MWKEENPQLKKLKNKKTENGRLDKETRVKSILSTRDAL